MIMESFLRSAPALQTSIIEWQQKVGRNNLPWQFKDSYTTWVSEIMLQQTQVNTVIPYFHKFMEAFPTVTSLASASLDEVLTHWSGLGYYRRAHNLHAAAKICVEQFNEEPKSFEDWLSLPGIGKSTAGAILSLSQGIKQPICDGNVKRVLSRYFGKTYRELSEKNNWLLLHELLPEKNIRDYNQGLMDIGAMLCLKAKPLCHACPLEAHCTKDIEPLAAKPVLRKSKKVRTIHVVYCKAASKIALTQRGTQDIWPSLWFFPIVETDETTPLVFKHELTHRTLKVHVHFRAVDSQVDCSWISIQDIKTMPRPILLDHIIQQISDDPRAP